MNYLIAGDAPILLILLATASVNVWYYRKRAGMTPEERAQYDAEIHDDYSSR